MAIHLEATTLKNFVIDGSERSVQDIVSKLKFISKIKEGDIIDVASLTLTPKNLGTSVYRTVIARGESRCAALEFFRQVIGEAFDLATRYISSDQLFFKEIGLMVINALKESKMGIVNHSKTYKEDDMYVSKVETLIETLDTKTSDLQRQIDTAKSHHQN